MISTTWPGMPRHIADYLHEWVGLPVSHLGAVLSGASCGGLVGEAVVAVEEGDEDLADVAQALHGLVEALAALLGEDVGAAGRPGLGRLPPGGHHLLLLHGPQV